MRLNANKNKNKKKRLNTDDWYALINLLSKKEGIHLQSTVNERVIFVKSFFFRKFANKQITQCRFADNLYDYII